MTTDDLLPDPEFDTDSEGKVRIYINVDGPVSHDIPVMSMPVEVWRALEDSADDPQIVHDNLAADLWNTLADYIAEILASMIT